MHTRLLFFTLFSLSTPALAIYKCDTGGKIVYSDAPCHNGKASARMTQLPVTSDAPDVEAATRRAAQEKQELQRIEARRDHDYAIAQKERQHFHRASEQRRKKCEESAQRARWAEQEALGAPFRSAERARLKARRLAEKHQLECGVS